MIENNNDYFATLPRDEIASHLTKRADNYYQYLRTSQLFNLWQRSYIGYYRASSHGGDIAELGDNGEFSGMFVNHQRSILSNLTNLTISQRPSWQAKASNADYKSQIQAKLANGLLDYYMRDKRLERNIRQSVEDAVAICGEGFIYTKWDANKGEEYGTTDTGAIIREGDVIYTTVTSPNIIRDPALKSFQERDWLIIRSFENKYTLAAQYPEFAEKIVNLQYDYQIVVDDIMDFTFNNSFLKETDLIPVYEFFHEDISSCPGGRYVYYLQDETVLIDSPLPYKGIPIDRISCGEIRDLPFGYTVAWDLLPLQKAVDVAHSTIQTNQEVFGVQNILVPDGSNIGLEELGGGLNVIKYSPQLGEPKAFAPVQTPAEIFSHLPMVIQEMETLSGVNSVVRGQPEASLKSGAALVFIASQAYQSSLPLQASYTQLLEDVGTRTINILKDYASVPRIAMIAGIDNRMEMKEFTGEDLGSINRVLVDVGNPLTHSITGRLELAEKYINTPPEARGMLTQIMATGRYEPEFTSEVSKRLRVKSENEALLQGSSPVNALVTDDHKFDLPEHLSLIDSVEARNDPAILERVLTHVQQHIDLLETGNPKILQLTGNLTPDNKAGIPQGQPPGMAPLADGSNPVQAQAQDVNMPSMPTNPQTGEQAVPVPGAMPPQL
jgi:hypothetical protein